jgi:hypothetical protein
MREDVSWLVGFARQKYLFLALIANPAGME